MDIPGSEIFQKYNKHIEYSHKKDKHYVKISVNLINEDDYKALTQLGWVWSHPYQRFTYEYVENVSKMEPPSEEIIRFEGEGGSILPPACDHDDIEE